MMLNKDITYAEAIHCIVVLLATIGFLLLAIVGVSALIDKPEEEQRESLDQEMPSKALAQSVGGTQALASQEVRQGRESVQASQEQLRREFESVKAKQAEALAMEEKARAKMGFGSVEPAEEAEPERWAAWGGGLALGLAAVAAIGGLAARSHRSERQTRQNSELTHDLEYAKQEKSLLQAQLESARQEREQALRAKSELEQELQARQEWQAQREREEALEEEARERASKQRSATAVLAAGAVAALLAASKRRG